MTQHHDDPADSASVGAWTRRLNRYRQASTGRSAVELAITAVPFAALWIAAWVALQHGHWWGLLLTVPAAAFLVRLFMLQHDCGHGAFFRHKPLNDWVGRLISIATLTPYDYWRGSHAIHHATAGDLGRRGIGDLVTLTVVEYLALPWRRRLGYRLFRHPAVIFGLGPTYVFLLGHRLPLDSMGGGWRPWLSTMATNLAIAVVVGGAMWVGGVGPFLLVQLPTSLLAGSIGVWLFYVQHQFEGTFWARSPSWSLREAALRGSSHYHLPGPLGWFTGDIGLHHVHHLNSRIPFYRLRQVLRDHPELDTDRLTMAQSVRAFRLSLWDETAGRLISFRELRASRALG